MTGAVATRRIAEHLAGTLRARGFTADVRPMNGLSGGGRYEGFVIGLAAMTEVNRADVGAFMLRHRIDMAANPVWMFTTDPLTASREFAAFSKGLTPRSQQAFVVASHHGVSHDDDFRDWMKIESWADGIGRELGPPRVARQLVAAGRL